VPSAYGVPINPPIEVVTSPPIAFVEPVPEPAPNQQQETVILRNRKPLIRAGTALFSVAVIAVVLGVVIPSSSGSGGGGGDPPNTAPTLAPIADADGPSPSTAAFTSATKLTVSDGSPDDHFGSFVAVDGDTLVVSARNDGDNSTDSGSVSVFAWSNSTWTEQAKLTASDGASGDFFGRSVAIHNETLIVGATGDAEKGYGSGSAYVFVRMSEATWTQQAKLVANDSAPGDEFGVSVAILEDTAVVCARYDDDNNDDSGSVYVFVRSGSLWTEQAKLTASDSAADARLVGVWHSREALSLLVLRQILVEEVRPSSPGR